MLNRSGLLGPGSLNTSRKAGNPMQINSVSDFRRIYRQGPYAWPGGYPLYFITDDGAVISFHAAKYHRRDILEAIAHKLRDGWRVVAVDVNWEDETLTCDCTGEAIPSAYGEK